MSSLWLRIISLFVVIQSISTCQPTPIQDIQDAARISRHIYHKKFTIGRAIPSNPDYIVQNIISNGLLGESLKVIVAKKKSPPTTIICFQGTSSIAQLLSQMISVFSESWKHLSFNGHQVKIMQYYYDAIKRLGIENAMKASRNMKYIVTGHSMGGSLACLFSLLMSKRDNGDMWRNPGSRLITFGAPRVGDKSYAKSHDKSIAPFKKLRLIYNKDIVPHLPFRHQGFLHASKEIWVENKLRYVPCGGGMKTKRERVWHVCPNGDGNSCSNGIRSLFGIAIGIPVFNVADHKSDKYVAMIEELKGDKKKLGKFVKDMC